MSFHLKLNLLFQIILFSVLSKASAFNFVSDSVKTPYLSRIILCEDSVVVIPENQKESDIFFRQDFILYSRNNNISFEFTQNENLEYQFFLDGFDKGWTHWKENRYKEYTNLPAGEYSLFVRYRDTNGKINEVTSFTFRVRPIWYSSLLATILYLVMIVLIIWALYDQLNLRFARKQYSLEQIINIRTEDLIIEKEKTEALLENVLPKNTAEEIMSKGKASKIKYNFVTVLFSDIQGFTKIAEEMNPEVLIDELDRFFFSFDSVVEKYGIEKIKTIGDAYMCAGGIPEKNRTNPVEVILAALEMKAYMKRLKETSLLEGMKYWDIRIGVHTGTVVAGVVGHKKLSYDIWGDTVNTASRMESSGEAGKINISGTTYEFVKEFFSCEYRGKMPVKYKGELEMYFVNDIISDLRDENGGPNRKFIVKIQMIKIQDIEEIITKMFDDEAPPNLYFHNSSHSKSINNQVELIANAEKLSEEEYINLKLASIFLLTGYIFDYEKPMEASFRLIEEILPKYSFDQSNIEIVKKIIDNSFSGIQESLSDSILHDARYDYLGRVDFKMLTDKLLRERTEYGKHSDKQTWIEMQKSILNEHKFITKTSNLLRSVQIEGQIASLIMEEE
jgi:adenylate cyclase